MFDLWLIYWGLEELKDAINFPIWKGRAQGCFAFCFLLLYMPRKSKDQTLPIGSRESFIGIILQNHSLFGLGLPGYVYIYIFYLCFFWWISSTHVFVHIVLEARSGSLKNPALSQQVFDQSKLLSPKLWRQFLRCCNWKMHSLYNAVWSNYNDLTRPKTPKR